ncbi:helix-turn-helix domain-containing protein [Streptomyces sp. NPDC057623]|uniref:helix-turn-helix domain-containing protein n=1 Tax=Streptomyces sp. NPDC057623 TaxID=3346187 RepID=UPI0036A33D78
MTRGPVLKGDQREAVKEQAKDWYLQGCTIHSTAAKIGRSYGGTRDLLLEAGVKLRPRGGMRGRFGSADR